MMSRKLGAELDAAMSDAALSAEKRAAILEAIEKGEKPMKKVVRPMIVLAAVIAALTMSALALSPTVQEMLSHALGDFAPYSQTLEGAVAEDQGIRIKAVSALSDATQARIYLEITDLSGDRLEAGMSLGYVTADSYDAKTRTALAMVERRVGNAENVDGELLCMLHFETIYPTAKISFEGVKIPLDQIADRVLESYVDSGNRVTAGDKRVLKPNQTPMKLEDTDLFSISSVGWDTAGNFHVQFAIAEGVDASEEAFSFRYSDRMLNETDYYNDPLTVQSYTIEGGKYIDFSFLRAKGYTVKDILPDGWEGHVRKSAPIRGDWRIAVPLEILPERTVTMSETLGRKNLTLTQITFSAMGMKLEGVTTGEHGATLTRFPVVLYFKDGTVYGSNQHMTSGPGFWRNNFDSSGVFGDQWTFDNPVNPEDIVAVAFDYWYIPINGNTGGPGHWLTQPSQ